MPDSAPVKPPALKKGDCIGVMAPSSYVEKKDIEKSKALLEKKGFKVFIHPQTYERHQQSAGTTLQKALAFQGLWQRGDIHAIWAAGGGNRCLHFLESINFEKLKDRPKIVIGFSDITALLNSLYAHNKLTGFHGQVFKHLHEYNELDHLLSLLAGQEPSYPLDQAKVIKEGAAQGRLIGGNLGLFQYLPGMLPGKFWKGALLFLEDCNEELSRLDRTFMYLKHLGILNEINGLALGQFTGLKDTGRPYGFSFKDIIEEHVQDLNIPVIMNAPFGHGDALYSLPIGIKAEINTNPLSMKLIESPVS